MQLKQVLKQEQELKRLYDFFKEERELKKNHEVVFGVDEAGRGPLAGPVYAACVFLPLGVQIEGLKDSKKLSPTKREKIAREIKEKAYFYSYGYASVEEVDSLNILNASLLAMERAIGKVPYKIDLCLVDGNKAPMLSCKVQTIVKGDDLMPSIAAASILAKTKRDEIMGIINSQYPEYLFAQHQGYGTKKHYEALENHGISIFHRKTFLKGIK